MNQKKPKIAEVYYIMGKRKISFIKGFSWAIPTAFTNTIAKCQFEEGDTLYNSKKAYDPWNSNDPEIKHCIQVLYSPRKPYEVTEKTVCNNEAIFKKNWNSLIKVKHLEFKNKTRITEISITQGQLLNCIWKGNLEFLAEPSMQFPILRKDLLIKILNNSETFKKQTLEQIGYGARDKLNVFFYPYDISNFTQVSRKKDMENLVQNELEDCKIVDLNPNEISLFKGKVVPIISVSAFLVNSTKIEKFRDLLKSVLYKPKIDSKAKNFRLSSHGFFEPYKVKNTTNGDIKHKSFPHNGIFYTYRINIKKIKLCPKPIYDYLYNIFENCPNSLFNESSERISKIKKNFELEKFLNKKNFEYDTYLTKTSKKALGYGKPKKSHDLLEKHLLNEDSNTVATEVPIWISPQEIPEKFKSLLNDELSTTGHIDILRMLNKNKIQICDYKSKISIEKACISQVLLYAILFSVRCGIHLSQIECCIFDQDQQITFNLTH